MSFVYYFRKYYKEKDGLTLDVGAFSKALEFSTGVKPIIIGKPDASFFLAAVEDMGLSPNEVRYCKVFMHA